VHSGVWQVPANNIGAEMKKNTIARRAAMRLHMADCPYKSAFGRALWRALF